MSASRKTDNFNLPLYNADDATSWLVDFNGAMTDIDSSLKQLSDNVSTDGADIDNLEKAVENLNKSVSQLTDSVIKVQENGKSNTSAITLLQTHDNEQDTRLINLESETSNLESKISGLRSSVNTDITALKEKNKAQDNSITELKSTTAGLPWNMEDGTTLGDLSITPCETPNLLVGKVVDNEYKIIHNDYFAILVMSGVVGVSNNVKSAGNVQFVIGNTTFPISDIIKNSYIGNVYFMQNNLLVPTKYHIAKNTSNVPIIVFDASVFETGNVNIYISLQGIKNTTV